MTSSATVVLAAGHSRRMGTCKALLPFGGTSALRLVVRAHLAAGVPDVLVVCREDHAFDRALAGLPARRVVTPHDQADMATSIRVGLAASAADHVLVHPVDIPLVRARTLVALHRHARETDAPVVVPIHAGRAGHPVVLGTAAQASFASWRGTGGLRRWIRDHGQPSRLPVPDAGILHDMDDPDAYLALQHRFHHPSLRAAFDPC
jgi:CTP:molybdopterin cytidylyltransferase MocA